MRYNVTVRTRLPALLLSLLAVLTASSAHAYSEPWIPGSSSTRVGAFTGVTPQNRIGGYQLASLLSEADLQLQLGGSTRANWLSITANASGSGLFQQRDPLGYRDSVNLYAGMAWDPVNNRDPTGRGLPVVGVLALWGLDSVLDIAEFGTSFAGCLSGQGTWGIDCLAAGLAAMDLASGPNIIGDLGFVAARSARRGNRSVGDDLADIPANLDSLLRKIERELAENDAVSPDSPTAKRRAAADAEAASGSGAGTSAREIGQEAHRQLEAEGIKEWKPEVPIQLPTGQRVRKDGVDRNNKMRVRIVKPDTTTGRREAKKRKDLMECHGYTCEVLLYDPNDPRWLPSSPTYLGPKTKDGK